MHVIPGRIGFSSAQGGRRMDQKTRGGEVKWHGGEVAGDFKSCELISAGKAMHGNEGEGTGTGV